MNKIKIELVNRQERFDACKSCAKLPHIHYYVRSKEKKFKDFNDAINHVRKELTNFADNADGQDFHSFSGGQTRESYLSDENIKRKAKYAWKEDNYPLEASTLMCKSLLDDTITEIVESPDFKGFIK